MATTVSMPQLGETVTEGTILRWAKQVGDEVAVDEVLVEISTDKVDTEVPSPSAGVVLEILVAEGDTVEVGTALAVIGEQGESTGSAGAAPSSEEEATGAPADRPDDGAPGDQQPQQESAPQQQQPVQASPPQQTPAQESQQQAAPQQAPQPPAAPQQAQEPAATPAQTAPPAASGESAVVTMPQLGETVTEGTILRWAKQVGDEVAVDEVLVEISTDKVDTEVPSPSAGVVLEILVPEGETVEVGTALARIGQQGAAPAEQPPAEQPPAEQPPAEQPPAEQPPAEQPPAQEQASQQQAAAPQPQPQAQPQQAPTPSTQTGEGGDPGRTDVSGRLLSPVVRKLIRENDLDVSRISGTGEGGRITRKDVETIIAQGGTPAPAAEPAPAPAPEAAPAPAAEPAAAPEQAPAPQPAAAPEPAPAPPAAPATPRPAAPAPPAPAPQAGDETVELDRLRVRIGENMTMAKRTAAHVWVSVEVDYERVERVRQAHKEAFKQAEGFSLTYLPFVARATIDALHEYPVVNSSLYLEERKAVYHRSVNLGIAIDLDQKGLVVASVRNADGLRLVGIARQIRALAEKARNGKLDPDDVSGSTFSITNPGPYGSFMTAPIINVPNTGILSTDTVAKRPSVVKGPDGDDVIAIRHIGYLGLTWDHRAFDGSTAVLFLQRIKQNLENWDWEQELT